MEGFGKKRTTRIVRDAIECNMHRGSDAGGWVASDEEQVQCYKDGGNPIEKILNTQLTPQFNPNALAVHTRAHTLGDPSDNKNNHPVWWNNVWTVHNGHIQNHDSIKRVLGGNVNPEIIPEVDSVAISMIVSDVMPDPTKGIPDDLINIFDNEIRGGNAFASMWFKHPGYMLIARGSGSPLFVAQSDDIVVWGSEQYSVATITRRFGKMKAPWKSGHVKEGTFLLLRHGKIVDFRAFPKRATGTANKATVNRVFKNWPTQVAYDDGGYSCWTDDGGPISYKENTLEKIHLLKHEHLFEDISDSLKQLLGDADDVYVWVHPKNMKDDGKADLKDSKNRYFLVFGDTEVVSTFNGTIRDIYQHGKEEKVFEPESRWIPIEDETVTVEEPLLGSDALFLKDGWQTVMGIGDIPLVKPLQPVARPTTTTAHLPVPQTNKLETAYHKPGGSVLVGTGTGATFRKREYTRNNTNPNFVFTNDRMCVEHKNLYSLHTFPDKCGECNMEAIQTVLEFDTISELIQVYPCKIGYLNWNAMHEHQFFVEEYANINGDFDEVFGAYWSIPWKERCIVRDCKMERFLERFHWAMLNAETVQVL